VQNPSHNYTTPGTYSTTLTVTDSASHKATFVKTVLATGATYYVSTGGSDSNAGTLGAPFLTLTKCQMAMQGGSTQVCTIEGGTYTLAANLIFTASDNGEMWIAGFGDTSIIDGASTYQMTAIGVTGLTIEGIIFKHLNPSATNSNAGFSVGYNGGSFSAVTGLVFRWNAIDFAGVTSGKGQLIEAPNLHSSLIDSNTFENQLFPVGAESAQGGAIELWDGASGNTFSHNLCSNLYGYCVQIVSSSGALCNNNSVDRNIAKNTNQQSIDMGAFYIYDVSNSPNPGSAVGNSFNNNEVFGNQSSNGANPGVSAYYLDTYANNVTLIGNVCNKCGDWALHLNSLSNATIKNNIFDISTLTPNAGAYVAFLSMSTANSGSSFTNNIIYNGRAWAHFGSVPSLWWLLGRGVVPPATIDNNLYYSPSGSAPKPSGIVGGGGPANVNDTNPHNANPLFVNPSANNYALSANSPAYSDIAWSALPTDQGPVDSPFVNN